MLIFPTSDRSYRARLVGLGTLLIVAGWTLVGCDVDAEEGDLDVPKYEAEGGNLEMPDVDVSYEEGDIDLPEVKKTQDGNFEMPKVDVELPEVETGTTEITVPTIDVDVPEEGSADADAE